MTEPAILMAHGHRFPTLDDEALDDGRFGDFKRYVTLLGSVTMLARRRPAEVVERAELLPLSAAGVGFVSASTLRMLWDRSERRRLARLVRDCDGVIARLPSVMGELVAHEARRLHRPVLVEMVGCPWDAYWNHSFLGKLVAPAAFLVTRHSVRKADRVVYVTTRFLQRRYPARGRELACSDVSFTLVDHSTLEARFDRIERLNESRPLVLATVGAVDVAYKGQEYVIRAIAGLGSSADEVQYWIIGGGDQTRLRALVDRLGVDDKVRFLGTTPHQLVTKILRDDVDLYIQPSLQEGMPRALLEAMAIGCPAVGTRVGGIPELLDESSTFEKKDIDAIRRVISEVTPAKLRENVEQNLATVTRQFDPERRSGEWVQFISEFRDSLRNEAEHVNGLGDR